MGSLKEFKEKCRKEKEAEIKDPEGYKRWRELRDEQDEFSDNYEPRGLLYLRCPNCKAKLKSKVVRENETYRYILRSCEVCGYEYAD